MALCTNSPTMARISGLITPCARGLAVAPALVFASALAWASLLSAAAQEPVPRDLADQLRAGLAEADIAGDHEARRQLLILARRAATDFPEDALLNHYAGYALYSTAGPALDSDSEYAKSLLEEAESFLERSVVIQPMAESHALLGASLGMRIGGPLSAIRLGRRSRAEFGRARSLGPENPRVRLLEGISAFHSPSILGGGHDAALEHFLAAIELFADDAPEPPLPAWGHAEAHAWLGQTYAALGRPDEARTAYERALSLEPGYLWVLEVLLPALG